jgi:hypothetical protein
MFRWPRRILDDSEISALEQRVNSAASAGDAETAWRLAQDLLRVQAVQRAAAECLLRLVTGGTFSVDRSLEVLAAIEEAHRQDVELVAGIGYCLEEARDMGFLNAAAPDHPLFGHVVQTLSEALSAPRSPSDEMRLLQGLATAARLCGRAADEIAERACLRVLALEPEVASQHYLYGLFLKTRGRFAEGLRANLRARELAAERVDSYEWNAGICATGAGEGEVALEIWAGLGNRLTLGSSGRPEGRYAAVKVRLAERPLAERGAEADSPGFEETIWIERLSPCHGIVRSILVQPLGLDYGDVVLFDGAPITYHTYGEARVPVFPHLATLERRSYRVFDFAGTQGAVGEVAGLSAKLEEEAVVYVHTEQRREMCEACWRDPGLDHAHDRTVERHVVTGRIAMPPGMEPAGLVAALDRAIAEQGGVQVYAPDLRAAAGQAERAASDRARFELNCGN